MRSLKPTNPGLLVLATTLAFTAAAAQAQITHEHMRESNMTLTLPEGYSIQTVPIPDDIPLEVGGLAVRDNGDLILPTRYGDVWQYAPDTEDWSLFTDGLQNPLGALLDEDTGDLFVAQMPELTRLVDENNDGTADLHETVSDGWGFTGNYHEFAFGPVRDSQGNFYISLNLCHGVPGSVKDSVMSRGARHRGWTVKISPDGQYTPFASGFRSPAGIGINRDDELFVTDNEGDWVPASFLAHVQEGNFYGHPASLMDHPDFQDRDLDEIPDEEYDRQRTRPAVFFPHAAMAQSPGQPLFDETDGSFGPFEGQIFVSDQTFSKLMRVSLEKVQGHYQGAVFNFVRGLQCGTIRQAFAPDGQSMWLGQTDRGWNSLGDVPYGIQRVVYDGQSVPFEMKSVHVTPTGFEIVFTEPADPDAAADPANYEITHWHYAYDAEYGSDRHDERSFEPAEARISDDGRRVELQLPEDLETRRVYHIALDGIDAEDGATMANTDAFYTLNHLPDE